MFSRITSSFSFPIGQNASVAFGKSRTRKNEEAKLRRLQMSVAQQANKERKRQALIQEFELPLDISLKDAKAHKETVRRLVKGTRGGSLGKAERVRQALVAYLSLHPETTLKQAEVADKADKAIHGESRKIAMTGLGLPEDATYYDAAQRQKELSIIHTLGLPDNTPYGQVAALGARTLGIPETNRIADVLTALKNHI
jgi:hypothetical protein